MQKRSDRPICTYEGTSEQTDYGNRRAGEEGETCSKTHTVRWKK